MQQKIINMLGVDSLYHIYIFTVVSIERPLFGWSPLISGKLVYIGPPIRTPVGISNKAG